jgi:penicillin-binding protein 2
MDGPVNIKNSFREQRLFQGRMLVASILIGVASLALFARFVLLQVVRHEYYLEQAQGNRARIEPIPANRGLIRDRNGKVLAENQAAYQLELVREQVPDLDATLRGLASLQLIPEDEIADIKRLVRSRRSFEGVPIRLRLSEEELARFAVNRHRFQGVDIRTRLTRAYPYGTLGVHALGYVAAISESDLPRIDRGAYAGTTLIGKLGVESAREKELHGTNGFREVLVNAQGRSVQKAGGFAPDLRSRAAKSGSDVILAIDLAAQQAAEEGLRGRRGAVVAIDPANGDILAFASQPGFDPSLFGRGLTRAEYRALETDIDRPLFNRALRGTYPPGSTVKPVIALAGLRYGAIKPEESIFCPGTWFLRGYAKPFREGKSGRHGSMNMEDAIAHSCDVYFYELAHRLEVDHISEFLAPFGYGKPTGIDISGELAGILPSRAWKKQRYRNPAEKVWFPGETVNFGVGQGYLTVTPMEQAHMIATIAARGKSFRPRLVTGLKDPETGQITVIPPARLPDVEGIPESDWDHIFTGMMGTIQRGTAAQPAANMQHTAYTVAGKTGTAQVISIAANERLDKKLEERQRDHSWFVAFAPVEAPRIALVVLVENGGFGAAAAAPIARKVMDAYLLPRMDGAAPAAPPPTNVPPLDPDKAE